VAVDAASFAEATSTVATLASADSGSAASTELLLNGITPPTRLWNVHAETRTGNVDAQARGWLVLAEVRTINVLAETREWDVRADNRAVLVTA
jgi:hypothetical protein